MVILCPAPSLSPCVYQSLSLSVLFPLSLSLCPALSLSLYVCVYVCVYLSLSLYVCSCPLEKAYDYQCERRVWEDLHLIVGLVPIHPSTHSTNPLMYLSVCPETIPHLIHVEPLINIYPSLIRDKTTPRLNPPMRRRDHEVHPSTHSYVQRRRAPDDTKEREDTVKKLFHSLKWWQQQTKQPLAILIG